MPVAHPSVRSRSTLTWSGVSERPAAAVSLLVSSTSRASSDAADLEEVPASAEPGEIQVRLGAPRKGDLEAVRQVVDERDEGIEARPIDEPVCVVEDEDGRLADPVDSSRKARHRRRQETRRRGADRPSDPRIDRGEAVERRGEVGEEDARLVVVVVDRQPRDGPSLTRRPVREEDRLPVAGRRDDRDDRCPGLGHEHSDEAIPSDDPRSQHGLAQLRIDERKGRPECRAIVANGSVGCLGRPPTGVGDRRAIPPLVSGVPASLSKSIGGAFDGSSGLRPGLVGVSVAVVVRARLIGPSWPGVAVIPFPLGSLTAGLEPATGAWGGGL